MKIRDDLMDNQNWKSPYYKYIITKRKKKVTINVTSSIPSFNIPIKGLSDVVAEFKKRKFKTIIDFGAGKLRNTMYLLQENFKVYSVEFKEAFSTPNAKERLEEARSFKNFFFLKYPKDFLDFNKMADAIIMVNVVNIVPEESERKKILRECAIRLKHNGLLLLMTQYGEPHYRPGVTKRLKLNDGWIYGLNRTYQTFNREYSIPELKELVGIKYFVDFRKITSPHHRAFLFQKCDRSK